jgi:hypothetical protein
MAIFVKRTVNQRYDFEFMFSSSAAVAAAFLSMFSKQHPSFSNNKGVSEVTQR